MVKKSIKEGNSGPFSKLESTYLKEKAFGMVLVTKSRTKPPTIILNSPQITVMPPNINMHYPVLQSTWNLISRGAQSVKKQLQCKRHYNKSNLLHKFMHCN